MILAMAASMEAIAMPGICGELAERRSTVQRPGDFFASGRLELLPPRLMVDGVGQIALLLVSGSVLPLECSSQKWDIWSWPAHCRKARSRSTGWARLRKIF